MRRPDVTEATPKRVHRPRPYRLDKPAGCDIDDCLRPHYVNGLCSPHWHRRQKYGDPLAGPPLRKPRRKSTPTGTRDQYHVNHAMVRKERGPAWQQACEHCGTPAKYWATIHGQLGDKPDDYMPLCGSCHWKYDGLVANLPDNTGSKRSPESRERMSRAALRRFESPEEREKMRRTALRREARKRGEVIT